MTFSGKQIQSLDFDECKGKTVRSIETTGCQSSMIVLFEDETILQVSAIGGYDGDDALEANSHVCFGGFSAEKLEGMGFKPSVIEEVVAMKRAAMDAVIAGDIVSELRELARLKAKYE